jgi:putative ATP-binding cassette transporter
MTWYKRIADGPGRQRAVPGWKPEALMAVDGDTPPGAGLVQGPLARQRVRALFDGFLASPVRTAIIALVVCLVALLIANAAGQIALNRWNQPFFDALARRDGPAFRYQLGVFATIAGALLCLNVAQSWLNQMLKLKLRQGLALDLFAEWMRPGRAFRLSRAGEIGVNPDQRLHEDARHLCDVSTDLAIGLLQSGILLVSFIGVLWTLSADFSIDIGGRVWAVPGYMVWAAVAYALVASLLSWWMGRRLIALNMTRYGAEAELRTTLMRVNENIDAIATVGGEAVERQRLVGALDGVLAVARRLVSADTRLTWVTAGYGWSLIVVPVLVAAPVYFGGRLSFGGLMMAVGAFNQVQSSLRWFIDNFGTIADWRATFLRVALVHEAIRAMDRPDGGKPRIALTHGPPGRLAIRALEVDGGDCRTRLVPDRIEIVARQRLFLAGGPGSGKTLVFNALAGLWPFGSGAIERPTADAAMFLAARTYFPAGSLRQVLSYPGPPDDVSDADASRALATMGLERLMPMLDRSARWDREFGEEDQQRLALVRAALRRPSLLVVDELFDSLDPRGRQYAFDLLDGDLATSAVIVIGSSDDVRARFEAVATLQRIDPDPAPAGDLGPA